MTQTQQDLLNEASELKTMLASLALAGEKPKDTLKRVLTACDLGMREVNLMRARVRGIGYAMQEQMTLIKEITEGR